MVRQVYSKRELRRMNRLSFQAGISNYVQDAGIELQDVSAYSYGGACCLRVFARKRPLFDHEAQAGEFDVIRVTKEGVVVHGCLMKPNLRTPYLATHFCPGKPTDPCQSSQALAPPARLLHLNWVHAGVVLDCRLTGASLLLLLPHPDHRPQWKHFRRTCRTIVSWTPSSCRRWGQGRGWEGFRTAGRRARGAWRALGPAQLPASRATGRAAWRAGRGAEGRRHATTTLPSNCAEQPCRPQPPPATAVRRVP